jgi:glycosyltransferase involved in cell wall biosynthesis
MLNPENSPQNTGRERLRVLQFIGSLNFGGAEKVVAQLASGIDQQRFDVTVCCTKSLGPVGEQMRSVGVPITVSASSRRWMRYLSPINALQVIRRIRPHVIHSHGLVPLTELGPLRYLNALPPWVHTFHYGNYPYDNARHMWIERTFCKGASHLIAVAEAQRDAVITHLNLDPTKVQVVHNGVQPQDNGRAQALRDSYRREVGFSPEHTVVGTVAVLSEQKGVSYLLRAVRTIAEKHPMARFIIVGGGPLEQQLRKEAAELGLAELVHFTGWRSDALHFLPAFDVFVMSSLWEAMPLTLLEAMAARQAIVVTDVGDNARFVGRGECALVVPSRDSNALAEGIGKMLASPALREELAGRALKRFDEHYTLSTMLRAYESLYSRAAANGRGEITMNREA